LGYVGEFKYAKGALATCGARVVIQTNRGIEIGEQVSLTCEGCDKSVGRQRMLDYVKQSGTEAYQLKAGRILREATPQDLQEEERINRDTEIKLARARELTGTQGLPMKFVACEHILGGERIIFHFMSDSRVDFRELVRDLAHEYHTRIEMHQVGARDEARLVADYEICGRECCCKNFLKKLRPVTMRMAKLQKATLDPSKVSGRCGRLRCCLRYEHAGYEDLNKELPRVGTRVRTAQGIGRVTARQVLTQLLSIEYDGASQVETLGIEDILESGLPKQVLPAPPGPKRQDAPAERADETARGEPRMATDRRSKDANATAERSSSDGGRRRGGRRRSARRRSGDRDASPPRAGDPPTAGAADDTAPPAGGSRDTESSPATPPDAAGRGRSRRRRGRRGGRRRQAQREGDSPPDAASAGTPSEPDRRAGPSSGEDSHPSEGPKDPDG
jgi:cell fate regulator YaaT (PSP1 superfamily)